MPIGPSRSAAGATALCRGKCAAPLARPLVRVEHCAAVVIRSTRGFTLLELIIAIAIFSLISVMAYSGLYSAQLTSQRVEEAGERLSALQVAFSLIARDLQQSVNRPVRGAFGEIQMAFMGTRTGVGAMLEFTRTGLRNPAAFPRSSLQRVAYAVEEDELLRLVWPSLDRGYGAEPVRTPILKGVRQVELRFMDIERNWVDQWPPMTLENTTESVLPVAVEVTIDTADQGKLVRLFRVPGDAPSLAAMMEGISGAPGAEGEKKNQDEESRGENPDENVDATDPEGGSPDANDDLPEDGSADSVGDNESGLEATDGDSGDVVEE